MKKVVPWVLLVAGGLLLFFGYRGYESASSRLTDFVTGRPPNDVLAMLIGGAVLATAGLGLVVKDLKK